jgi:chromosome segregation ATPase
MFKKLKKDFKKLADDQATLLDKFKAENESMRNQIQALEKGLCYKNNQIHELQNELTETRDARDKAIERQRELEKKLRSQTAADLFLNALQAIKSHIEPDLNSNIDKYQEKHEALKNMLIEQCSSESERRLAVQREALKQQAAFSGLGASLGSALNL